MSVELGAVLEEAGNGSGVQDAADYTAPRLERAERAPLPARPAIGEPASDQNEQRPEQPTAVLDNPGAKRIVLEAGALPWAVDLGIEPNPDGASDELAAEVEVVASGDPEAVVGDGDRLRLAEQAVRPVPGGEGGGQDAGLQRVGDVVEENDRSTAEEDGSDLLTELLIPAGEGHGGRRRADSDETDGFDKEGLAGTGGWGIYGEEGSGTVDAVSEDMGEGGGKGVSAGGVVGKREIVEPLVEQQGFGLTEVVVGRNIRDGRNVAAVRLEEEAGRWLVARSVDERPTLIEDRGAGDPG